MPEFIYPRYRGWAELQVATPVFKVDAVEFLCPCYGAGLSDLLSCASFSPSSFLCPRHRAGLSDGCPVEGLLPAALAAVALTVLTMIAVAAVCAPRVTGGS